MILARFFYKERVCSGFIISGHAGGKYGHDIVCAGTSSAVMFAVNIITDYLIEKPEIKIRVRDNAVGALLTKPNINASQIMEALRFHLEVIQKNNTIIKPFKKINSIKICVLNKRK